jgi:rare lipoprotein A
MRNFLILIFFLIYYALPAQKIGYTEKGVASYYGRNFQGKRTAKGERFNMNAMTCAHKTLPFNTYLKVTNLRNKRVVYVRVNDRGPYGKGRIIDLTKAAAAKIGIIRTGMARVKIEVVDPSSVPREPKPDPGLQKKITLLKKLRSGNSYTTSGRRITARGYGVEIGRFRKSKDAAAFILKYEKTSLHRLYVMVIKTERKKIIYRVVSGNFENVSCAQNVSRILKLQGYNGPIREN